MWAGEYGDGTENKSQKSKKDMQKPGINHVSGKKPSILTQWDMAIRDNGDKFKFSELGKSRTDWNTKQ